MKNHENPTGTMKNQPGTMKNHENRPRTMKNQTGTIKNHENRPGQGRNKQKRYRHTNRTFLLYIDTGLSANDLPNVALMDTKVNIHDK